MRRGAAILLPVVAVGLAGCESTQARSERLEAQAQARPAERGLSVARPARDVTVGKPALLRDANGTALVVELRNRSSKALANVPVAVELTGTGAERVYRNDTPGIERGLVSAPLLAAGRRTLWVNDQITPTGKPRAAKVVAGAGGKPVGGRPPQIDVRDLEVVDDPTSGLSATGRVVNGSTVEQRDLVVTVAARRDGRWVAAGRAVVRRLRAKARQPFTAFLIGDARGADLEAVAPPTTLR